MPELYPFHQIVVEYPIIKKLKAKLIKKCVKIKSITYVKLSVLKFIKIAG